jgi:DNA (cytosine-5)-methyltransferase 1
MNVLSLFAGIGGLELGLERAGMTTVGQVELDPWCRQVLARHWPDIPQHDDVRTAPDWWASTERPPVDVVCGGFPCQPFSSAGRRRGVADERWGWPWMADVVRAVRPRYLVVENVADLVRDADAWGWVLGDLAALGFDAEWGVLSACALGAPHARERVFLVAYTPQHHVSDQGQGAETAGGLRLQPRGSRWRAYARSRGWLSEPALGRVADGVPRRLVVDELHALGNAVVPAVSEHIGRLIVAAESLERVA